MSEWEPGRQGSGYFKMLLKHGSRWDLYLLRYPRGSSINGHRDPVDGAKHYRLNIILTRARAGGKFWKRGRRGLLSRLTRGRATLFRPDVELHGVDPVFQGERNVLSFGFVTRDKETA